MCRQRVQIMDLSETKDKNWAAIKSSYFCSVHVVHHKERRGIVGQTIAKGHHFFHSILEQQMAFIQQLKLAQSQNQGDPP